MANNNPEPLERQWETGWEGHQRAQAIRLARLPLQEKLAWLEQAHLLAQRLRTLAKKFPSRLNSRP